MPELSTDKELYKTLAEARTIAVLGAHDEPGRAAFYVPDYLHDQGYRILPVNPFLAGQELWGEKVRPNLTSLKGERVDVVDVFRRPSALPVHLAEILAMDPRPRVVWLQLGIRDAAFVKALVDEGIDVVQDRCTLADHRRLGVRIVERAE